MVFLKRDTLRAAGMQDYLLENREVLHFVADAVPALVAFVDNQVRYAFANEAYRALFGLAPDELAGHAISELIGPSYESVRPNIERALTGHRVEFQKEVLYPTAGRRTMSGVYTPRFAADGSVLGYVAVVFDVTQQVEAEKQVRALTEAQARTLEEERRLRAQRERDAEQLAAAAELRERFVGMLGHDLRGPLTAILSTAQMLERRGSLSPADLHAVRRIGGSAARMQRMIEQMLDLTRILHSGGLVLHTEPTDLRRIVEDILAELRAVHPGVELRSEARGDCRGEWDVDRLCQVVWNLVANAVKHGGAKSVEVRLDGAGEGVVLEVHNQGAPIPCDVVPSIFEPFWSGGQQPAKEGLGLGLYITREIVAAHGGEIAVASSPAGTTFTVCLPRAVPLGARVIAAPPPDEPRADAKG